MSEENQTYGQKAVASHYHGEGAVKDAFQQFKDAFAVVIDALDAARKTTESGEQKRLLSIAITEAQAAQMWAVKAITWKD